MFELYYSFVKMVWFFCSQAASAEGAEADDDDDGGGGGAVAEQVDPYDLLDPVDILSKLPKDFYEKVGQTPFVPLVLVVSLSKLPKDFDEKVGQTIILIILNVLTAHRQKGRWDTFCPSCPCSLG